MPQNRHAISLVEVRNSCATAIRFLRQRSTRMPGMLPIWDAVGALPMSNDTQKLDSNGQTAPPTVPFESSIRNFLGAEDKTLSPLEAGSVQKSPESVIGSRGRIRTYDQSVNSRPLYH